METYHAVLAAIWFSLLGLVLVLTLLLDGFDLGVGLLSLVSRREEERALMLASMATVWHANQTWLVVLGGLLFGAFPLVYGVVLSALYIPVALMLFAFIVRGVSIEFYAHASNKLAWGRLFGWGSLVATLAQGLVLGAVLGGLRVEGGRFQGGVWDWLSPFSCLVALCVVAAYLLLGATYLIWKTEGETQERAYSQARAFAFYVLVSFGAALLWTRSLHPFLSRSWAAWPGLLTSSLPLVLAAVLFVLLLASLQRRREGQPFLWTLLLLALAMAGLAGSLHPYVIPPRLSLREASAPALILGVMLVGFGLVLPFMLWYNAFQYRVFRGKAQADYNQEPYAE